MTEKQGSTRLRMAQNSRQYNLLKKTRKWEGLAILLIDSCLAYISVCREHPRFQKGISPWKKVNAFFSRGASFLAKTCRSGAKTDPFRGWKAAQNPYGCAVFEPHSCSSDDRPRTKQCLSASISRISFVKKSEIHFLYIFEGDIHDFIISICFFRVFREQFECFLSEFGFYWLPLHSMNLNTVSKWK